MEQKSLTSSEVQPLKVPSIICRYLTASLVDIELPNFKINVSLQVNILFLLMIKWYVTWLDKI